jgi:hypothetical protein
MVRFIWGHVDLFYAIQTLHQPSKGAAAAPFQPKEWVGSSGSWDGHSMMRLSITPTWSWSVNRQSKVKVKVNPPF